MANVALRERSVSPGPAGPRKARHSVLMDVNAGKSGLDAVKKEAARSNQGLVIDEGDSSLGDHIFYVLENVISTYPNSPFFFLLMFVVFCVVWMGAMWLVASSSAHPDDDGADDAVFGYSGLMDSLYFTVMTLVTGGYEDEIPDVNGLRWIYFLQAFTNIVVVSVLIGFMNDSISGFMASLSEGRTQVVENGHTLILGWSEATIRVVIQIAFLRRQFQQLNENSFFFLKLPILNWLRIPMKKYNLLERPSTPLAWSDIVIMTQLKTKEEMHELLSRAMDERGIDPARTKIGQNVICRVGDPTNTHDLVRVGAHKASAIITMMTERDVEEFDLSDGKIENGATLRCCLALRHVLFARRYSKTHMIHPDCRIVLQMTSPSVFVDAACFKGPAGNDVIIPMEITMFLNSLMFSCAAQPGLAKVILAILDFEGTAVRRRKAENLRAGPKNEYGGCIGMSFRELQYEYTRAVFIGIVEPNMTKEAMATRGYGLCPDPDTVIKKSDMLIFVGPKSSPARDSNLVDTVKGYKTEAQNVLVKLQAANKNATGPASAFVKTSNNVLVCGWRVVWSTMPERLRKRVMEIARLRERGSCLIFVNGVRMEPQDETSMDEMDERVMSFKQIMESCGFRPLTEAEDAALPRVTYKRRVYEIVDRSAGDVPLGIYISHIHGDASDPEIIEPVIMQRSIHTAIVLGTQATKALPAHSRDTRVLSIMLLLRKLWMSKNEGVPMHVVGENQEDMTARLALGPQVEFDHSGALKKDMHEPDFINTQAIYARVLVQTLAYPNIRHAIKDLFDEFPGSADLVIVKAGNHVMLNTPLKWGVVQQCVLETQGERTICIGYIGDDGNAALLPVHDQEKEYNSNDRLVVIRRDQNPRCSSAGSSIVESPRQS